MKVEWRKIKQYNSKKRYVVMVDKEPICIVKGERILSHVIAYLEGYDEGQIQDGKIKKILDKILEKSKESIDVSQ